MLLYFYHKKETGLDKYYTDEQIYKQVSEWLEIYHNSDNPKEKSRAKTLIVTRMLPIVKRIAKTIARRSYDPIEDMVQAGSIGLLKAIEKYSPEINDNFKIYAGHNIIGAMRHYLRDKLNAIQVPRHIQELSYRINTFVNSLTLEELDEITSDYIAEVLNVPTDYVDMAVNADRRKTTISLEDIFKADENSLGYEELISSDEDYKETLEIEDAKLIFKDCISKLPDECREIMELFYFEDVPQKEIAERLELNKMQVYRRIKKAFNLLYENLKETAMNPKWELG